MATSTKKTTNSITTPLPEIAAEYVEATDRRIAADEHLNAAKAAADEAHRTTAGLRLRLAEGDDTVTAADLAAADADTKAKEVEAPLAAAHLALVLAPVVDPGPLDLAKRTAAEAIGAALAALEAVAIERRHTVRQAIRSAQATGLPKDGPLTLGSNTNGPMLRLNGVHVRPEDVGAVLASAMADAARTSGWPVSSPLDLVAVEPARQAVERLDTEMGPRSWDAWTRHLRAHQPSEV